MSRARRGREIDPDEIFIDSSNLPAFDTDQFEGRIERPIGRRSFAFLGAAFIICGLVFAGRAYFLQVVQGAEFKETSENNRLSHSVIFADRGIIMDRNGVELAFNRESSTTPEYPERVYANIAGTAHVLGYAKAPQKDSSGNYYQERFTGIDGVERAFDTDLAGENGLKIVETDALLRLVSESTIRAPVHGAELRLSLDAPLSAALYEAIRHRVEESGFEGGAGVIMDVETGEVIAMVSYPEFDPQVMERGSDVAAIRTYLNSAQKPLLNRVTNGLYTPGSIVKPFLGLGALMEGIISPETQILANGYIAIPNPYNPEVETRFNDWKVHGWVDMRHAIAVSSDVYFYEVGGGFEDQKGLGIARIDEYFRLFGFGSRTGIPDFPEREGVIPSPAWKEVNFPEDPDWRVGNTYHTAIGQYGTQVTPLQMARAYAGLANGEKLPQPTLRKGAPPHATYISIDAEALRVVREGMRLTVTEGTAQGLSVPYVKVAAKTGTAELGASKAHVNSWSVGFFPYETPRYSFAILLERGARDNLIGASSVMRSVLDWMAQHSPGYFSTEQP